MYSRFREVVLCPYTSFDLKLKKMCSTVLLITLNQTDFWLSLCSFLLVQLLTSLTSVNSANCKRSRFVPAYKGSAVICNLIFFFQDHLQELFKQFHPNRNGACIHWAHECSFLVCNIFFFFTWLTSAVKKKKREKKVKNPWPALMTAFQVKRWVRSSKFD